MNELLLATSPHKVDPYISVVEIDFSKIPAGSTSFTDVTGKQFSRGGGTAIVQGGAGVFSGDGGFEAAFPAAAFDNAKSVQITVIFEPITPPTTTGDYQSLVETGAARTPRITGYFHCFNSAQTETWVTGGANNVVAATQPVTKAEKQTHVLTHTIASNSLQIQKYNALGSLTSTNSGFVQPVGASGGTTISVGASWVAGRKFFFKGKIHYLKIGVIKN